MTVGVLSRALLYFASINCSKIVRGYGGTHVKGENRGSKPK